MNTSTGYFIMASGTLHDISDLEEQIAFVIGACGTIDLKIGMLSKGQFGVKIVKTKPEMPLELSRINLGVIELLREDLRKPVDELVLEQGISVPTAMGISIDKEAGDST